MKGLMAILCMGLVALAMVGCEAESQACDVGVGGFSLSYAQPVQQYVAPVQSFSGGCAVGCAQSFSQGYVQQQVVAPVQAYVAPVQAYVQPVQAVQTYAFAQPVLKFQKVQAVHSFKQPLVLKVQGHHFNNNSQVAAIRGPLGTKTVVQADGDVFRRGLFGRVRQVR